MSPSTTGNFKLNILYGTVEPDFRKRDPMHAKLKKGDHLIMSCAPYLTNKSPGE